MEEYISSRHQSMAARDQGSSASFATVHRNLPLSSATLLELPACFEDPPRYAAVDLSNACVHLEEIPGHLDRDDIKIIEQIVSPVRTADHVEPSVTNSPSNLQKELGDATYFREVIIANHPLLPHIQNAIVERHRMDYAHAHSLHVGMRHVDEVLLDALRLLAEDPSFGTLQNTLETEAKVLLEETERHGKTDTSNEQTKETTDKKTPSEPATKTQKKTNKRKSSRGSRTKKRGATPTGVQQVLKDWLFAHALTPYPAEEEKALLCQHTGLSLHQLNNWFINARRRILPAYLRTLEAKKIPTN